MPLLLARLISLLIVFSCVYAHAHETRPCDELLIPQPKKVDVDPDHLSSELHSQLGLSRYSALKEVSIPAVRCQYDYGVCYLYAGQTHLEAALKNRHLLKTGDAMLVFPTLMKVFWERYHDKNRKKPADLEVLIRGGDSEYLDAAMKGPNFYLDAEQVEELGGPQKLAELEEYFLYTLTRGRFLGLGYRKDYLSSSNYRKILRMLKLPFDRFMMAVRKLETEYLDEYASVYFRELEIDKINYEFVGENKSPPPVEFRDLLRRIVKTIDSGDPVYFSGRLLFTPEEGLHGVLLTGYFKNGAGELAGFKILNSWGEDRHKDGFLFVSVDELYSYFGQAGFIKSFEGVSRHDQFE